MIRPSAPSSKSWRARSRIGPTRCTSSVSEHRGTTLVELYLAPGETGKVIGRQGRTVAALRTLAATAGEKEGKKVTLEVRDTPRRG